MPRAKMSDAGRQRLRRERAHAHQIICPTPVSETVISVLIELHWLSEQESADRGKIGCAISRLLTDLAENK